MQTAAGLVGNGGETVDKLHREISQSLRDQSKRFLIVIDDIDRLTPDEALMIFRLVKSVGHLPNVIYLMVFDRTLAEKIASDRFPSEGPQYLEKIIQVSFDLPPAQAADLQRQMQEIITRICGQPTEDQIVRFMNVFYDVVAPEIKSPRDIVRLGNALPVTWAAIGGEVDLCDFVGLEAIRVLRPDVYRRLRANRDKLQLGSAFTGDEKLEAEDLDKLLFGSPLPEDSKRLRRALMRVFPPLERHWSNVRYGDGSQVEWDKDRRACSKMHVDTYFRFTLATGIMPASEIDELVTRAGDQKFVEETMLTAIGVIREDGTTKAAMILDQLNVHSDKIKDADVEPLLKVLFRIADRLDVPQDEARGFSIGNNQLRLHWLLRRLTKERFTNGLRSSVMKAAITDAPLGWLVDFSESAYRDHHPREGRRQSFDRVILMSLKDAGEVRKLTLGRIKSAATSGELLKHKQFASILFRWREMQSEGSEENESANVVAWANSQMQTDDGIVALVRAFTGSSWDHSSDDVVAKRTMRAQTDGLELVLDLDVFRRRVDELASGNKLDSEAREIVTIFLEAWKRQEKRGAWD